MAARTSAFSNVLFVQQMLPSRLGVNSLAVFNFLNTRGCRIFQLPARVGKGADILAQR
jgi:hypothetical protein